MNAHRSSHAVEPVIITAKAVDEIRRHARDTYPDECCGALIAIDGTVLEALRLPNTTAAGPRRRFTISPSDYRIAEERARQAHGQLAGFYHSHPDHPARPSVHDLEQAWPNLVYAIVSVSNGIAGDIRAWHLREDRSQFDEGELQWHTEY